MEPVFGHDQLPGEIAVISDITAAPTSSISSIKLSRLGEIGAVFKRGETRWEIHPRARLKTVGSI